MANRYPLVIDTLDANKIKELQTGDNLNLADNSIVGVQNITALGTIEAAVLTVNGINQVVEAPGDTKLLWVIREHLRLTGTKFGCGLGLCGACTVHMNGEAVRSCQVEIGDAEGSKITTIEGLNGGQGGHPVQQAWLELEVAQCGYCQSGQIMAAAALLADIVKNLSNILSR